MRIGKNLVKGQISEKGAGTRESTYRGIGGNEPNHDGLTQCDSTATQGYPLGGPEAQKTDVCPQLSGGSVWKRTKTGTAMPVDEGRPRVGSRGRGKREHVSGHVPRPQNPGHIAERRRKLIVSDSFFVGWAAKKKRLVNLSIGGGRLVTEARPPGTRPDPYR